MVTACKAVDNPNRFWCHTKNSEHVTLVLGLGGRKKQEGPEEIAGES